MRRSGRYRWISLPLAVLAGGLLLPLSLSAALPIDRAVPPGGPPGRAAKDRAIERADTTWFGGHEWEAGEPVARSGATKEEVMWTFDRGDGPIDPPPPLIPHAGGWSVEDRTGDPESYFRVIDASLDLGEGVVPPILEGERSLWIGVDRTGADSLCWPCGPGYGNDWCQRFLSEPLAYDATEPVELELLYFSDLEPCRDGVQIYLILQDGSESLLNPYPTGACPEYSPYEGGTITGAIGLPEDPAVYLREITPGEVGGAQTIRFALELRSRDRGSDEDCGYPTERGPFGADAIRIQGGGIDRVYDFETGLQDWEPTACAPVGDYAGVADIGVYPIVDPCICTLEGNVLEAHAGTGAQGHHPEGQHVRLESPICDLGAAIPRTIGLDADLYVDLPLPDGVLFRVGWRYYPMLCEATGETIWSPRVGEEHYRFTGSDPMAITWRFSATEVSSGTPVPLAVEKVRAIFEIYADCAAFSIANCTGETNFSPLLDNLAVFATANPQAPRIRFDTGAEFQDVGSYPSSSFDPRAPGPANVAYDIGEGTPGAIRICGDSLVVTGPWPTDDPATRWEADLWWRVAKRGPFQTDSEGGVPTRYGLWKERVADGREIDRPDRPQFTFGRMDSVEGHTTLTHKFASRFREDDDDFVGEGNVENEMIWDDCLLPGTRIEYFVTAHYVDTPYRRFVLPDTTGGFFQEFEILPSLRTVRIPDCGGAGFDYCVFQPATLYIDADNASSQRIIDRALAELFATGTGERCWDRYDYLGTCSCWNAPFVRGPSGSNNGMTLSQVLGYRAILLNTGSWDNVLYAEDLAFFQEWLTTDACNANLRRQVFLANGDQIGEALGSLSGGEAFLQDVLRAALLCDAFHGFTEDPGCGEENDSYCVRLLDAGGPFPPDLDVDAYGNGCPTLVPFNVFGTRGGGIGNRRFVAEEGAKEMSFAQVLGEDLVSGNYRTVLDGVSWHHLAARDPGGGGEEFCPRDLESLVAA
ncbi:MAG: hypothetical protein GF346_07930, partial [Candidatus Eisenbacteria bacterium]|nr:hypothetical protein [Candidatus Latescibacterota bacterium]MBD3302362.1 hypothetical protein [Candidatus Eisenbacteria bacterium]